MQTYNFISDDHVRIVKGIPTGNNNKGAFRRIEIKTDGNFYFTTIYITDGFSFFGDNVQMAEKKMKVKSENEDKIVLRGFGRDIHGFPFDNYGLTIHKKNGVFEEIVLHMHDRKIDIVYKKFIDEN